MLTSERPSRQQLVLAGLLLVAVSVPVLRSWAGRRSPAPLTVLAEPATPLGGAELPMTTPAARQVMERLDAARAAGYADPEHADVTSWATAGCGCAQVDRARLVALRRRDGSLRGARSVVRELTLRSATTDRLEVELVDELPAYDEVGADGSLVRRFPGRGPLRWHLVVERAPAGWRLAEVLRDASGA